jgi:hypothetical protein
MDHILAVSQNQVSSSLPQLSNMLHVVNVPEGFTCAIPIANACLAHSVAPSVPMGPPCIVPDSLCGALVQCNKPPLLVDGRRHQDFVRPAVAVELLRPPSRARGAPKTLIGSGPTAMSVKTAPLHIKL